MARRPTENQVKEAVSVLYRDYYSDVEGAAEELIRRIKRGEITSPDRFTEALEEEIDGNHRVIYTAEAVRGILASGSWEQAFEEGMGDSVCARDGINWSGLMYFAMKQDVLEYIERNFKDPHDEETYGEAD